MHDDDVIIIVNCYDSYSISCFRLGRKTQVGKAHTGQIQQRKDFVFAVSAKLSLEAELIRIKDSNQVGLRCDLQC